MWPSCCCIRWWRQASANLVSPACRNTAIFPKPTEHITWEPPQQLHIDCCKRPTSDIPCRTIENSAANSNHFKLLEFLKLINGTDVSHQYGTWWASSIQRRGMHEKYRVPQHFLTQGAMLSFASFFDTWRYQGYGRRFKERNRSKKKDR